MIDLIKSSLNFKVDYRRCDDYKKCIIELIRHEKICSMKRFVQHSNTTCLEHSIYVSYISYLVCKRLGFDYNSAARGGLLHDFFLYDWHKTKPDNGLHGFTHPYTALENADGLFQLNDIEKDIIVKHMWPLTLKTPKYIESLIVILVDKYCAFMEIFIYNSRVDINRLMCKIMGYRV